VPAERTFVTEIATALGMLGDADLDAVLARQPSEMANLTGTDWERLRDLRKKGLYDADLAAGFANGLAFLAAADALNSRRPRIIEWTGGRRSPGDEVVPADLRVDHVYLISCKYLSKILHNPSPARLVEGLLTNATVDLGDWYHRIAPQEYQALYEACVPLVERNPPEVTDLRQPDRDRLAKQLASGWPAGAEAAYASLCRIVSEATAAAWRSQVTKKNQEAVLWRLLRIGSAPYFILGASRQGSMRLRIDSPWDWRQVFRLRSLELTSQPGGQPRVGWIARYVVKESAEERAVRGHVEIRWSHGRFGQQPEAKVYLDSPHHEVPGYHPL
jgi:hypothetical protein